MLLSFSKLLDKLPHTGNLRVPLLIIAVLLMVASWNYLLFHTLIELFTIGVAVIMFVVIWYTYEFSHNHFLMYLGCGYLWVGLLELLHTLSFQGIGIFSDQSANLSMQFWLVASGLKTILLLSSTFFFTRALHRWWVMLTFASLAGGFTLMIFQGWMPVVFVPGLGVTWFKVILEYIAVTLLAVAMLIFLRGHPMLPRAIQRLMVWVIGFTISGEILFTQYLYVYDSAVMLGHICTFFAAWLIFAGITRTALIQPFVTLARNSSTYDAVPQPTIVLDNQGIIRQANQAARALSGMSQEMLIGLDCHNVFHSETYPRDGCPVCQNIAQEISLRDLEWKRQGRWENITLTPIEMPFSGHHHRRGMIQVITDITRRKQAEEAQRQAQAELENKVVERTRDLQTANAELKKLAKLKDDFLAGVSHELRSPLNSILGSTEILLEQLYGPLTEQQVKNLLRIEENGRHLLSLINDILDVAKVEAGKLSLYPEPVMPVHICEACLNLLRQQALKKNLQFVTDYDSDVRSLNADPVRLKQILLNLLNNAIKFTREGGKIGLRLQGDRKQRKVIFTVWDTGIGISAEQMKRLFKPFIQLNNGLNREYEGTGLGLTLVKSLAELHGGSVTMTSQVGQGSQFVVQLPWNAEELQQAQPSAPPILPPASSGVLRILIVDDNIANLETVCEYLEVSGYEVLRAMDGHTGIQIAKNRHPDLILMDIQMPGMDGLEAIQILREDATTAKISIIALTALAMPGDRERCLEAGADDYLSKPVRMKVLREKMEVLLKQQPT